MTRSMTGLCCLAVTLGLMVPGAEGQEPTSDLGQVQGVAESIVAREEAASERPFDLAFRVKAKELLATLPLAELLAQTGETGLGLNSLGDSQADLVYTPVTPCRIIDTRNVGGALAVGSLRSFLVTGTNYSAQGGSASGCAVPYGPTTAAVINFVAANPTGAGNLQVTPYGTPMPLASIINYRAGVNLANGLVVAICNPSATTCTSDITIKANVSAADLVADVQGYFQRVATGGVGTILIADSAVTAPKISPGVVVRSLNSQTDAVTLAGSNGLGVSAGSGTVTVTSNATAANTAGAIVARDGSGNFSAGTITLAAGRLASGQTMRGDWTIYSVPTAAAQFLSNELQFPLTLASAPAAPAANFIPVGGPSTANCPGTASNPQAAAGQLCVYATVLSNATFSTIASAAHGLGNAADPYGAFLIVRSSGTTPVQCYGTWAVTAP